MSTTSPSDPEAPRADAVHGDGPAVSDAVTRDERPGGERPARVPLRRSTTDKVIAGVAGGLGRYLGVDPVIIRIALVVLAVTGGSGVLLYIIAWVAIPEEQPGEVPEGVASPDRNQGIIVLGAALMITGGLVFADRLIPSFATFVGPLVLLGLGAALIVGARR